MFSLGYYFYLNHNNSYKLTLKTKKNGNTNMIYTANELSRFLSIKDTLQFLV